MVNALLFGEGNRPFAFTLNALNHSKIGLAVKE